MGNQIHYPVEFGPSDARRLECACGNADPAHADSEALSPCRSPYCECEPGKCTHPGFYDARAIVADKNRSEPCR